MPSVDRSTKPHLQDDKLGLRDLILPTELMNGFLRLAAPNTMSKTETCGVLAGKLERNKLIVTHLLIPKQTGSPDSCVTHNEEDIFDYQDQYNLITLGWIHVRACNLNPQIIPNYLQFIYIFADSSYTNCFSIKCRSAYALRLPAYDG